MSKTIFSHLLNKDVILDGEALAFYKIFHGKEAYYYGNAIDPSHYLTLDDLGYTVTEHLELFIRSGFNISAYKVAINKVPPVVARNSLQFLKDYNSTLQPGTWFSEAMSALDEKTLPLINDFIRAGWSAEHAFILAAFPEREARLQEAIDNDMQYYDIFLETSYDLAMVRRLTDMPGAYFIDIKKALDQGFTEKEIKSFGCNAVKYYTVDEIRSVKIKPSFFKNLLSPFPLDEWKPSVDEVEALLSAGLKNGKQYKDFARVLGLKFKDKGTLSAVTKFANLVSHDDAMKLYGKTGAISASDVSVLEDIINAGHTVDDYIAILDAVDEGTEAQFRVEMSLVSAAKNVLGKGLTVQDIADNSAKGIPLAQM